MKNLLAFILVATTALPVIAQTKFVDDTLFVPLRSGAGTSFRIVHKGIKSGTPLEIINADKSTGYSEVRTPSGLTGFLPSRYLTNEPIARAKLAKANKELSQTQANNKQLKAELSTLKSEYRKATKGLKDTETQLASTSKELSNVKSISANALNLDSRNRELRESNEQLRNELELLQAENIRLKDKSESNMMIIGGALVLLGVIIALLIPMLKPSKKTDSWA